MFLKNYKKNLFIRMSSKPVVKTVVGSIVGFLLFASHSMAADWHVNNFIDLRDKVNTAAEGDTIYIAPGVYTAPDTSYWKDVQVRKSLHFKGDGGRPVFIPGTVTVENNGNSYLAHIAKGIFDVGIVDYVTFENIEFRDADNTTRNAAGIRMETGSGDLTVKNCYFYNNNNGILYPYGNNVSISDSEFIENGQGDGRSHGIYVIAENILVEGNAFRDTIVGNHIKSLGHVSTIIRNNIIDDGLVDASRVNGSRAIDSTAGGDLLVEGNIITRAPNADSFRLIYYAISRTDKEAGNVIVRNNTIYNSYTKGTVVLIANESDKPVSVVNNTIHNYNGALLNLATGLANSSGNHIDNQLIPAVHYKDDAILGTEGVDTVDIDTPYAVVAKYDFLGGDDDIKTGSGKETIFGGAGHDTIHAGEQLDFIFAEEGDDVVFSGIGANIPSLLAGGAGNDVLVSSPSGDILLGGAGNDILYGVDFSNILIGHGGDDILIGGIGADPRLTGGDGNDYIDGGSGSDGEIKGGNGDDIILGGLGRDGGPAPINGGDGIDTAVVRIDFADCNASPGTWQAQPFVSLTPQSPSSQVFDEIGDFEHYSKVEYIQFNDGVYNVNTHTFSPGEQRVDISIYDAVTVLPTSAQNVEFFFASNNPNNDNNGENPEPESDILINDDFSTLENWDGNWDVVNGVYQAPYAVGVSYNSTALPKALTIETDFSRSANASIGHDVNLYFHMDEIDFDPRGRVGYYVRYRDWYGDAEDGLYLYRQNSFWGGWIELDFVPSVVVDGETHHLKIVDDGSGHIQVYFDGGSPVIDVQDSNYVGTDSTFVGVYSYGDAEATFDNFKVTE